MKTSRGRLVPSLALVTVMTIFGLTFIAIKVALQDLGPYTLAFSRFVIATITLSLAGALKGTRVDMKKLPWGRLALMGLLGITLFFALQNLALTYTTASSASLILSSIPAITAIVSSLILNETISRERTASIGISILGVALVILGGPESTQSLSSGMLGDLLLLLCAFLWACYTVIGRSLGGHFPYLAITLSSTTFGTLFLGPLSVYEYLTYGPMQISEPTVIALLFLGLVASALAFLLYNFAVSQLEASEVAIYVNLSPVITVCAANLILHETLTLLQLVGGIVVLSSIYLAGK
ncbi:MAG: DMT family transporter [Candidatus Bathyarchaeota archaeon]|nr:MAG: DMT family transporter [Candidatus Bathyarchaeota archaeon]